MQLITTNHYSTNKDTKHKKVLISLLIQRARSFQTKQKATNWIGKKKKEIAGTLPFFLPVKYPKIREKILFKKTSSIQNHLTLQELMIFLQPIHYSISRPKGTAWRFQMEIICFLICC